MMSGEPELLPPIARAELVERLNASGLPPSLIAEAADIPLTQVRVLLRRHAKRSPEDEELERQWAGVERDVIRFIRLTMRRGTQSDRMSLAKIVAGRLLAKRAAVDSDGREEMLIQWAELREEQRSTKQLPNNVRAFPSQLDQDDDEYE